MQEDVRGINERHEAWRLDPRSPHSPMSSFPSSLINFSLHYYLLSPSFFRHSLRYSTHLFFGPFPSSLSSQFDIFHSFPFPLLPFSVSLALISCLSYFFSQLHPLQCNIEFTPSKFVTNQKTERCTTDPSGAVDTRKVSDAFSRALRPTTAGKPIFFLLLFRFDDCFAICLLQLIFIKPDIIVCKHSQHNSCDLLLGPIDSLAPAPCTPVLHT